MEYKQDIYAEPLSYQNNQLKLIANYFDKVFNSPISNISNQEIMAEPLNSNKSNTIMMDVMRTRASLLTKQNKLEMEKILNHFCRLRKIQYKQGLNEILGPFILFRTVGFAISKCYVLFRAFFDKYCLNFYYDKDFNSLQIIFKMITIVIKYHDPSLSRYLQNYQIEPQIYCISWLMTMFSSKLSFKLTYILWQFLITQNDDYFIFFLIVAIIMSRKEQIIQTKNTSIFTVITNLIFKNEEELMNTIKIALLLRRNTPSSIIVFFKEKGVFKEKKNFQRISYLLKKIDSLSVFLVSSAEISLRQHLKLGLCEKQCYFCSLRQPLTIPYQDNFVKQTFPLVYSLLQLSNDIRLMKWNIQFIVVDLRKVKTKPLPKVQGLYIYQIQISELIQLIEAKFIQNFMQLMGKQHFLFVLNEFSFQNLEQLQKNQQFYFCQKFLKILNSYSYNYLSILQGGEVAYKQFLEQNKMKSQIMNSKLVPVSQYNYNEIDICQLQQQNFIDKSIPLTVSQILYLQSLYDCDKFRYYIGVQSSQELILFILEGYIMWIQKNNKLIKLLKQIKQKKSMLAFLIEEKWVLNVPFKIFHFHSIFLLEKITVRLHHNNCLVLYFKQSEDENVKDYRLKQRKQIWICKLQQILRQDLQKQPSSTQQRRINFDSLGLQQVKQISSRIKQHYKQMIRLKKHLQHGQQRKQQLNNNIIMQDDGQL